MQETGRPEVVKPVVDQQASAQEVSIGSALRQFTDTASTPADWLWIVQLRALAADGDNETVTNEWASAPDRGELEQALLRHLDQDQPPSLAEMVVATSEKWQTVVPDAPWQPTESLLLNELEQLARSATSVRLDEALGAARDGRWEGGDGAWTRFAQTYPLIPSRNQRDSAMSELRLVWLNQWKTLMDTPDFDRANSFYESAFEADVLGEDWLIRQSRRLSELEQSLEQAAEDEQIASLLEQADRALEADRLMVPAGNNAYEAYQAILEREPEHTEAQAGMRMIAERYAELARLALDRADYDSADQFLSRARRLAPDLAQLPELTEWRQSLENAEGPSSTQFKSEIALPSINLRGDEPAERLIDRGESALRADRALEGYAYLIAALRQDPGNRAARRRLDQRAQRYIRLATRDIANRALDEAGRNLAIVNLIAPDHPDYAAADRALRNALDRNRSRSSASRQTQSNLTRLRLNVMLTEASANLDRLTADPANQRLALQAAEKIEQATQIAPQDAAVKALASRHINVLEQAAGQALEQDRVALVQWYIDQLSQLDPGNDQLPILRQRLNE